MIPLRGSGEPRDTHGHTTLRPPHCRQCFVLPGILDCPPCSSLVVWRRGACGAESCVAAPQPEAFPPLSWSRDVPSDRVSRTDCGPAYPPGAHCHSPAHAVVRSLLLVGWKPCSCCRGTRTLSSHSGHRLLLCYFWQHRPSDSSDRAGHYTRFSNAFCCHDTGPTCCQNAGPGPCDPCCRLCSRGCLSRHARSYSAKSSSVACPGNAFLNTQTVGIGRPSRQSAPCHPCDASYRNTSGNCLASSTCLWLS